MASTRKKTTKDGKVYYEIRCVSRTRPEYCCRWYPKDDWSAAYTERELQRQAAEIDRQYRSGELLTAKEEKALQAEAEREAAKILTLKQYGDHVFMPAKAVTCSENTRSSFQSMLDLHVYPVIGDYKLTEVNTAMLRRLLMDFQNRGKSHATCVKLYVVISLLFKMAYEDEAIERNPMDRVHRPKPRKDEGKRAEVECFTASELRYILDCLDKEPLKWRTLIRLLIDTGIRRGECCGLQWRYVDFKAGTITIAHNLCYTKDTGVYLDTPKNGRSRTIDVSPEVMALLKELREEQAAKAISKYVFTQDDSPEPMHPQTPEHYMRKFGKRNGVDHLHPHKLRHSFASLAITSGADIVSVSEILGHASPAITLNVYSHASEESKRKASQIFREALQG